MEKNKKRILSILLALSILLSVKIGNKKSSLFMTNLNYGIDGFDKTIEHVIDYDESDFIKYVGRYVPQGVSMIENKLVVSLCDSLCLNNSLLCIYDTVDKTSFKVSLDMIAHVGGIAYDEINNLLWITAKDGNIRCYNASELNNAKITSLTGDIYVGENLINHKGKCSVAYMCINENKLYVGNYKLVGNSILKEYEIINNEGNIELNYIREFCIPSKTQGVCFYQKENKEYIIFSRSYGNTLDSMLQIYEFNDEFDINTQQSINYYFDPMLEQICIDDEMLYGVFEYNANIYRNGNKKDDLFNVEISKLIK